MTGVTEGNIAKNLLRGTHEGEINWHCTTDDWDGPVEAYVGEYRVVLRSGGSIDVFSGRVKYVIEAGSIGEDLYRTARNIAWEHADYESVIEDLDDFLVEEFEDQ